MKYFITIISFLYCTASYSQTFVTKDIKSFGAKGDGKTNDHAAFEKAAAFFNKRGGYGKLLISTGIYIVGKQIYTGGKKDIPAYTSSDVLRFNKVNRLTIEGSKGVKIKYKNGLRYGSFNPLTGKAHTNGNNFYELAYAAPLGSCIYIFNSKNVTVKDLELDGNNGTIILGGSFGDVGRQLPHYGVVIANSKSIKIDNIYSHHFGQDGICVANVKSDTKDDIKLMNSRFEYNGRQGFSWIGGNDLKVKNCKFNFSGQGKFYSPPAAGVDIEAEWGPVRNGQFEDCEFINNKGCGLVSDVGDNADCSFKNCTFWGVDAWSIWTVKPGFTFKDCKIYGSFVHGYNSPNDKDATKFIDCYFEDKPYKGKQPYGNYLAESNGAKRLTFESCTFVTNTKKGVWMDYGGKPTPEEKYQFNNCKFIFNNNNLAKGDFIAVIRGIYYRNCTFEFKSKDAKEKGYYLNDCCDHNIDGGGNKVIYAQ